MGTPYVEDNYETTNTNTNAYGKTTNYGNGYGNSNTNTYPNDMSKLDIIQPQYNNPIITNANGLSGVPQANYGGTAGFSTTTDNPGWFMDTSSQTWTDGTVGANASMQDQTMNNLNNKYGQAGADRYNQQNSTMGKLSPYVSGAATVANTLGTVANIYAGFKTLGLMEDQVDIAKDKWNTTKYEIARIQGVRNKLNKNYMA